MDEFQMQEKEKPGEREERERQRREREEWEKRITGSPSETGTQYGTALSEAAREYGARVSEAATHAKDYVSDKVSVVGDKFKDLQNADFGELAENAKDYARRKPGQALLISAAVGFVLGLIIRGRR